MNENASSKSLSPMHLPTQHPQLSFLPLNSLPQPHPQEPTGQFPLTTKTFLDTSPASELGDRKVPQRCPRGIGGISEVLTAVVWG